MRLRKATIAIAFHSALSVITTWPLALHWRTRLPLGSESALTVPQFNLWTLQFNADRIGHFYRDYFDAPIFWPDHGTFGRSEIQPLTGALFALFRPIAGNVGAYNLCLLAFLCANGLAMTAIACRLGASLVPALLTGALAQTLAFVFNELGVLQLIAIFPFLLLFERLIAYRQRPSSLRLGAAGAWLGVLSLVSGYYALFAALALLVAGPIMVVRRNRRPMKLLGDIALACVLAVVIAAPFTLAQQSETADGSWSTKLVTDLSAKTNDWITHDDNTLNVPWAKERTSGQALFPGGFLLALATTGVVVSQRGNRKTTTAATATAALMFIVSFGLRIRIGWFAPYAWLRDHAPGFDRLRSPFRAAALTQVVLVILSAVAIRWLWDQRTARVIAVCFVVMSVVETVHWNQPLGKVSEVTKFDWVVWLKDAEAGPVVMIPFPATGSVNDYEDTTTSMLAGLEHGHPLLNGYTGLFPKDYIKLRSDMLYFPDAFDMELLANSRVRYLVMRHDFEKFESAERFLDLYGWNRSFEGIDRDIWVLASTPIA